MHELYFETLQHYLLLHYLTTTASILFTWRSFTVFIKLICITEKKKGNYKVTYQVRKVTNENKTQFKKWAHHRETVVVSSLIRVYLWRKCDGVPWLLFYSRWRRVHSLEIIKLWTRSPKAAKSSLSCRGRRLALRPRLQELAFQQAWCVCVSVKE